MDFDKEYKNHKLGLGLNQRAKKSHQEENCNIGSLVPDEFESVVAKYVKALSKEDENFEWSLDKRRVNPDYSFEDQRVKISSPDWIIKSGYYEGEQLKFIVRLIDKEFLERDSIQGHIAKDKDDQMNVTSEWLKRYYEFMHHYDMVIYAIFLTGNDYGSIPNDKMMSKEEIEFLSKREHLEFNIRDGKIIVLGATHKNLYDLIRVSLNAINREIKSSKLDESTNLGLNKQAKKKFDKTDAISNIDYKQVVKNFVMCYAKSSFSHLVDSLNYTLKFIGAKCGDIRSSGGSAPAVWYTSTISNPKDKILIFRLGDWGISIENPPKEVIKSSLLMNRYCFSKAKTKRNIEIDSIVDEFASFVCEVSLEEGYENIIDLLNELRDIVNVYDYSKFKALINSVNESVTSLGLNKKAKDKFDKEDVIDNMHKIVSLEEIDPMIRHLLKENGYHDLKGSMNGFNESIPEFCWALEETQIKKGFVIISSSEWVDVLVSLPNVAKYHYNCIEIYFCIHNGHEHVSLSCATIGIPSRIEEEITLGTTKFQPATYSLMAKLIKNIANYKLDNQVISENASNLGLNKHAQKKFKNVDAIDNLELEYVDLGLPSGTLWCKHNYGAISEEETGERYVFDEVQKLEVDVPSKNDFIELYNNCDYKTEYVNEIYGIRFISKKNEKSIFLPVASSKNKSVRGERYWSSTEFSSESGYNLSIDYDLMDPTNYNSKFFKYPVRPVKRVNCSVLKTTNESMNLGLNKKAKQKFNDVSSNDQVVSNVSDIQEVEDLGSEKFANFILEEGKRCGINEASDEVIRRDELEDLTTNLSITNLRGYVDSDDSENYDIFVKEKVNIAAFRSSKPFDKNKRTFDPIMIYCVLGDKMWNWDEIMLMKIDVDKEDDSKITQVSFGRFSLNFSKKGFDWRDKSTFQNEHSYGPLVPLDLVKISKGIAETNEDGTLKMSMINARLIVKMFVMIFKHINDTVKQKYVDKYGDLKQDSNGNYVWVPMTKVKEVSLRERLLACKQCNSNNTFCRLVMDHCWRPGFKKSKVNESNIGLGLNKQAKKHYSSNSVETTAEELGKYPGSLNESLDFFIKDLLNDKEHNGENKWIENPDAEGFGENGEYHIRKKDLNDKNPFDFAPYGIIMYYKIGGMNLGLYFVLDENDRPCFLMSGFRDSFLNWAFDNDINIKTRLVSEVPDYRDRNISTFETIFDCTFESLRGLATYLNKRYYDSNHPLEKSHKVNEGKSPSESDDIQLIESKVNEPSNLGLNSKAKKKFSDVDAVDNVAYIKFEDPEVERICHEHGVYTINDVRQVTSIRIDENTSWFEKSSIKSFNEFKYFTGLKIIERYSFYHCHSLQSINIPDNVSRIGERAFCYCESLQSINIPDSVTYIKYGAFSKCSSLQSINIPNSVTSIGNNAFDFCESLQSINIPNSVTIIGGSAFYKCASLQSIKIPNSVTKIEEMTFAWCKSLQSINIPNSVTSIGGYAFYECKSLQSIYISKDSPVYDQIKRQYPKIQLIDPSEMNEAHNLGLNKQAKQKHENVDAIDNLSDYVNLGLPSGTLWCKHNLGAEKEYEAGEYLDYNSVMGLDLRPGYMPSKEDFKELVEECSYAWTTVNDVDGVLFTSYKNGESVFFPAVGMYTNTGRSQCKTSGFYWSSTLETSTFANNLLIEKGLVSPNNRNFKDYKFSIRLVSA